MESLHAGRAFKLFKDKELAVLVFDLEGERVNKFNGEVLADLLAALAKVKSSQAKALLLKSGKRGSFIVGADINVIKNLKTREEALIAGKTGQDAFSVLEDLGIPTIAAIDGPAAGGGTELSLACRYRICSDSEKTSIALPEVKLGILPGWGGSYRLPKLIGLPNALDMMLTGKNIRADKALKMGLVNLVVPAAIFEEKIFEIAHRLATGAPIPEFRSRVVALPEKILESNYFTRKIIFKKAREGVLKAGGTNYPSPLRILDVVERSFRTSRSLGMRVEADAFADLAITEVAKHLVNLFFLVEDSKKRTGSELSEEAAKKLPPTQSLAVLGAGVMGGGIAAVSAGGGIRVYMKDIKQEFVNRGLQHARKLFEDDLRKKKLNKFTFEQRLGLIRGQTDESGFGGVDLLIEAVVEDMNVKKKVFAEVETKLSPKCVIASNTSSLRVTEMAKALKDPSRFIGLHFFNPVHRMPLVEVVAHAGSSKEAIARGVNYVKAIGKTPVVCKDGPGFLVNRLLMPWLGEAGHLLDEGYDPAVLDRAIKNFGLPMGPCELLDEVGLDVACKVGHILNQDLGERAKPGLILDKIVAENKKTQEKDPKAPLRLGRKSGLGFYKWDKAGGRRQEIDHEGIYKIAFGAHPPKQPEYTEEALIRRMLFPMINEAAIALEEKIVSDASQVDLAMIFGMGFPPFRGGLLRYADSVGLKLIVGELSRLAEKLGSRIAPSEALKRLADGPGKFYAS